MKVRLGILEINADIEAPILQWDYTYLTDLPAIPNVGDRLDVWPVNVSGELILNQKDPMGCDLKLFRVERVSWQINYPDDGKMSHPTGQEPVGKIKEVIVWVSELDRPK